MPVFEVTESASTATGDLRSIVTIEGAPSIHESAWAAPGAQIIGNVVMNERSSVWFNAVLRGDGDSITVGADSNIQDLALCHVDPGKPLHIGNRVTVGHAAILHGCTIEDDVLIGMGATVMNGARIGAGCIVGAGAIVLEHFEAPPFSLLVGAPAKVKRTYADQDACRARAAKQAQQYAARAQAYRRSLCECIYDGDDSVAPLTHAPTTTAWTTTHDEGGLSGAAHSAAVMIGGASRAGGAAGGPVVLVAAVAGAVASILINALRSRLWRRLPVR